MKTFSLSDRHGIKITLIYLVISGLWIFFSDRFLDAFIDDPVLLVQFQTYKGWFFVLVTATLLFLLIKNSTVTLVRSRERLEESIGEKQVLMNELNHRVKNNLAIIAGLIELQADQLNEENRDILKTTQYRIYSLADIQELLYREKNLNKVPFHEHLRFLTKSFNRKSDELSIRVEIEELEMNINQAIPLGLLINEIFSQIKLNGFRNGKYSVGFRFYRTDLKTVATHFSFSDLSENVLARLRNKEKYLEATLIDLYTKQLKGTSTWTEENGEMHYRLEFEQSERPGSSSRMEIQKAS